MTDNFTLYKEQSSTLRTWLVAYGIGLPALILANDALWIRLATAGITERMAICFISGVALQVALAALNKTLSWILYSGELTATVKDKTYYKNAQKVSGMFWIDVVVDIATVVLFACGTYSLFLAVA